jgi:hypothetical protein
VLHKHNLIKIMIYHWNDDTFHVPWLLIFNPNKICSCSRWLKKKKVQNWLGISYENLCVWILRRIDISTIEILEFKHVNFHSLEEIITYTNKTSRWYHQKWRVSKDIPYSIYATFNHDEKTLSLFLAILYLPIQQLYLNI